jgi:hypothetical protein
MDPDTMNPSQPILFDLLKSSLWGTMPDEKLFAGINETTWNAVFKQATKQGVVAVAFEGVLLLPAALQPPRKLKIAWGVKVNLVESNYTTRKAVAEELADLFWKNNIRMLIFKGITLAQYYQIPGHREFGDLDIYLFGKKKEGDQLLRQWGAQEDKKHHSYKHSVFRYKGVSIENHACFLNVRTSSRVAALNTRLIALAEAELGNAPDGKPLFPAPDFTALFFMAHAIHHFTCQLPAGRYFYDWAVFLHANKGKWDMSCYCEALSEAGLKKMADFFTSITVDYLGLPLDEAPPFERDSVLEEKILTAMRHPLSFPENKKQGIRKILAYKYHRLMDRRWRRELVYPGTFHKMILNSILYHLHHPEEIWTLRKR